MKTALRTVTCIGTASLAFALGSCSGPRSSRPHAVTKATIKKKTSDVKLPPASDTYGVLGVLPGLEKFAVKYDDRFYRGGEPCSEKAAASLRKMGVKTIVSVTPNDRERELAKEHGFTLLEVPFEKADGPSADTIKKLLQAVEEGSPVYAHCHGGTHRGGILGLAYRLHVCKWPEEKALIEFGRLGGSLLEDHAMIEAVKAFSR